MKVPAAWLAGAFAAGIAAAMRWQSGCAAWIIAAAAALAAGVALLWLDARRSARLRRMGAWGLALAAWAALGGGALSTARASVPANHISRLIAARRLPLDQPLRWRGRLREDPAVLPWGTRYEIHLEAVEQGGAEIPIAGGLRASLYSAGRNFAAGDPSGGAGRRQFSEDPPLRAGDLIEVLLKAHPPRTFLDPGAFDVHSYLEREGVDLTGSIRAPELLRVLGRPVPGVRARFARARGDLLARLDALYGNHPARAAVLRAMLLGDRSFVDSRTVAAFQATGAYHVLVIAGLHVGALAVFFFWFGRRLRWPPWLTALVTLAALGAYTGVVQERAPILRAALMVAFYICARPLFRQVEMLNTIALAGLALLVWKPDWLADSGFQLSFLAAGIIAALAVPWIERTSEPYRKGLDHLGDATRDGAYAPKIAQFRIEMRAAAGWIRAHLPGWLAARGWPGARMEQAISLPIRAGLRLWDVILLSALIQWGMMPLLARDFHRVTFAAPLSNVPAVLLTGLIVPFGFLALMATFVWSKFALLLAKLTSMLTAALLASVRWFSRWPRASYRIPGPPIWLILAFFAALIWLALIARSAAVARRDPKRRRRPGAPIGAGERASAAILAALTILVAWYPFAPRLARGRMEATVLDVGQGDSIFTAFPDGRTMLVDGGGLAGSEWHGEYRSGPDVGEEVVSPYLWSRGLKRLDAVALTHSDHDHLDGLLSVLENFRVRELWISRDRDTPEFRALIAEAHARGTRIVNEAEGKTVDWDGARIEVLWPPPGVAKHQPSNDDSLVLRLEDGAVRFLLTGDIEKHAEAGLVAEGVPLAADFLKVPHHGSKTSSTEAFLAAVHPRFAAVSAGAGNPFGHPAEEVVARYQRNGIKLLRTDQDGAITALTDGHNLAVSDFAGQE